MYIKNKLPLKCINFVQFSMHLITRVLYLKFTHIRSNSFSTNISFKKSQKIKRPNKRYKTPSVCHQLSCTLIQRKCSLLTSSRKMYFHDLILGDKFVFSSRLLRIIWHFVSVCFWLVHTSLCKQTEISTILEKKEKRVYGGFPFPFYLSNMGWIIQFSVIKGF